MNNFSIFAPIEMLFITFLPIPHSPFPKSVRFLDTSQIKLLYDILKKVKLSKEFLKNLV